MFSGEWWQNHCSTCHSLTSYVTVCILKYREGHSLLMVPLPKVCRVSCNYHNQFTTLPSTTKHCVICKHTPEPSMKSTTTDTCLPVTTFAIKIGLPKMVYTQICPGMYGFLLSSIQSCVITDLRAVHPSLSYAMV